MDISKPNKLDAELTTASYDHTQVYELAKQDMNFLAGLALPQVTEYEFPPVFLAVWTLLLSYIFKFRDFTKIALGLPRGFGKTSVIKLFCLYCILFTNRQFILVFGATASHAQNTISDIADMLDEPNIKAVFGDWRMGMEKDTQEVKKFGFRGRNIILAALGQGGSVRGLNIKNTRPDVMIFDDIQTKEDAKSTVVSEAIETWMLGTAMKAASHKGCLYIFLANMYPEKTSILRKLKKNQEWIKFIAGGILSDGTSLWEALKPIKQLLQEFRNDFNSGHPEIFYAEVLNDENASINNNIDLSKIPAYPFDEYEISAGNFIIIDPSNDKTNSDAVSIGVFHIYNGLTVLREVIEGRFSPGDTISEALKLAAKYGVSLIVIEANAYQYSLCYWFDRTILNYGLLGVEAVPIYSGSRSKNSRILDMFKSLVKGELYIHPEAVPLVHMQILQFNALKTTNVDGILDLLTYAPRVLSEFEHYITINNPLDPNEQEHPEVLGIEHTSLF